jgi:hypothetical protein
MMARMMHAERQRAPEHKAEDATGIVLIGARCHTMPHAIVLFGTRCHTTAIVNGRHCRCP